MGSDIKFSAEPRILIITMRRLGDVLLSTPLARALRQGIPGARVDMLAFRGTEGMLAGNLDIDDEEEDDKGGGCTKCKMYPSLLLWLDR